MDVDDLRCIGKVEVIYPNQDKKFVFKTYIETKIKGIPQELEDNYAFWMPITELISNKKRFAITHLMDKDLKKYFEQENLDIRFICDYNHNIKDIQII